MKKLLLLFVTSAVVLIASDAFAQGGARDARAAASAAKGTAELTVIVTTNENSSRPLRRVSVTLQAGELDVPNIAVTDDDGRVVFRNLAAGNYLLSAARTGYVRTYYGSKLPGRGPGAAVTVLDGQKVSNVQIRMLRGSVITGTIRTANGRPAPNQIVQAIMVRSSGGDRRAVNIESGLGSVSTDDRGVFRIFGLAPGDYIVLVPSTAMGGEELRPMTSAELKWADSVVAGGAATAPAQGVPPAPDGAPRAAYAPVYFPGTAAVSDAAMITLGPGEERAGTDFALQLVPTAQVSGRLIDSDGRPQGGVSLALRPARPDGLDLFSSIFNASARTNPDGTFTIRGVKPGNYALNVRATPKAPDTNPPGVQPAIQDRQQAAAQMSEEMAAMGLGGSTNTTHWASENLAVQGTDIDDIVLTLRPGMTVTGRIVYEATTKTPPTDFSRANLSLLPAPTGVSMNDLMGSVMGAGSFAPKIAADGTFTIQGVAPGRYRLNSAFSMMAMVPGAPNMTGGWTMKSVMAGGRDIADAPIDITAGMNVPDVVVTFTDQPSELSGSVIDPLGRVSSDFPIIVFSTDQSYWTLGSRRVQMTRPSSDGKFKVTGLPGGEYYVCAVTAVDRTEVYDPAFLSQIAASSFKIAIKDGEKKTLDLKLGGGGY